MKVANGPQNPAPIIITTANKGVKDCHRDHITTANDKPIT